MRFNRLTLGGIVAALALGACSNGSAMLPSSGSASSASATAQTRPVHCIATFVVHDPCMPNEPKTLIPTEGQNAQSDAKTLIPSKPKTVVPGQSQDAQSDAKTLIPPHPKTVIPGTPRIVSRHS